MGKDMRRGVSMLMNMLLVLAFLQAPFQHTHHHDCPSWHPHGLFHIHTHPIHASGSRSAAVRDGDSDDDAQFREWHAAASGSVSRLAMYLAPEIVTAAPATLSARQIEPLIEGGHDPPILPQSSPRSPPA